MVWKKVAQIIQNIGFTIALSGVIFSTFAFMQGEMIPINTTICSIMGLLIWLAGMLWEEHINMERKRERKRFGKWQQSEY